MVGEGLFLPSTHHIGRADIGRVSLLRRLKLHMGALNPIFLSIEAANRKRRAVSSRQENAEDIA